MYNRVSTYSQIYCRSFRIIIFPSVQPFFLPPHHSANSNMKNMKKLITISALLLSLPLVAQENVTERFGMYGRASFGVLAGEYASSSFRASSGVRFGNHIETGIALGWERYSYNNYAPVMLEARYLPLNGKKHPYIQLSGGYLAGLNPFYRQSGSYTLGAHIGITHYYGAHFGISTEIGYRYSFVEIPDWYYWNDITYPGIAKQAFHALEIRIGVAFR